MNHGDIATGLKQGALLGAAVLALAWPAPQPVPRPPQAPFNVTTAQAGTALPGAVAVRPPTAMVRRADFGTAEASVDVRQLAQWAVGAGDNGSLDFAILDKRDARLFVFGADGRLRGASPVLLGFAAGDDTVPGIGDRPLAQVKPEERTTPAGRFVAEPGRNANGEDVVWVDYDAAVSMHRVRLSNPAEHRLERLATPTPADNRISYGCINLPPLFFEGVLWPSFRGQRGIVYVLPETKPLAAVFPGIAAAALRG